MYRRVRGALGLVREATIIPYAGYQHPDGIEVRGRVLEEQPDWSPLEADTRLRNVRGIGRLFHTHELPGEPVTLHGWSGDATTVFADDEGYIDALLPAAPTVETTRWDGLRATLKNGAEASLPILRVGSSARFGILSDIDDTVMQTGAENLFRNLWTTFTGNSLSRMVYRNVPALFNGLVRHEGVITNPLFYLSSSPWNLYGLIRDVLERNAVPWGPIFLRDFGIDRGKFINNTHGEHKVGNACRLLQQFDGLPFLLVGDLGQADAEVYLEVVRRRPGQVLGVIIHQPSDRAHTEKRRQLAAIEEAGVTTLLTRDYAEAITLGRQKGWID